jgi:hypothetical protein
VVGAAWLQIQPHLGFSLPGRLDPTTEKVHRRCTPRPTRREANGAATGKRGERYGGAVSQVKPLLPPPLRRSGHGNVKIRVNSMPGLDMNNRTIGDY